MRRKMCNKNRRIFEFEMSAVACTHRQTRTHTDTHT